MILFYLEDKVFLRFSHSVLYLTPLPLFSSPSILFLPLFFFFCHPECFYFLLSSTALSLSSGLTVLSGECKCTPSRAEGPLSACSVLMVEQGGGKTESLSSTPLTPAPSLCGGVEGRGSGLPVRVHRGRRELCVFCLMLTLKVGTDISKKRGDASSGERVQLGWERCLSAGGWAKPGPPFDCTGSGPSPSSP